MTVIHVHTIQLSNPLLQPISNQFILLIFGNAKCRKFTDLFPVDTNISTHTECEHGANRYRKICKIFVHKTFPDMGVKVDI